MSARHPPLRCLPHLGSIRSTLTALGAAVAALAPGACGSSMESTAGSGGGSPSAYFPGGGDASAPGPKPDAGAPAVDSYLPPEQETESSYRSPVATERYVWVANPVSGKVARVDATTLEVTTVAAGNAPTHLAPVPHATDDVAVVVNVLSDDVTLLRARPGSALATSRLALAAGANSLSISPRGRWAIAWTDARAAGNPGKALGFQDVTVLDLTEGAEKASRLSVGYRPAQVAFSSDDTRAFAITQDGVSVLDLASPQGPRSLGVVSVSDSPLDDVDTRDVSVTPDGAHSLVRTEGSSKVAVVALSDGKRTEVQLPGACTDLDVAPDGSYAVAVVRETSEAALLPLPAIASDPTAFQLVHVDKAIVGSVVISSAARVALLFSNASPDNRVTAIDFTSLPAAVQPVKLRAAVWSAFAAPSGATAVVVHQAVEGVAGSFSALSIQPPLPAKIVGTLAPVTAVAMTPSGDRAVVAERDDAKRVHGAYLVRSATQQVDRYALASPVIAVGTVTGAKRAYVAQKHAEGRITFIDLETGLARTLTGFELGARVIDGSQP